MTVTGSGDAARELLALDKAEDVAPPDIRNGTQERLGAGEGTGSGVPCVVCGNPGIIWTRARA